MNKLAKAKEIIKENFRNGSDGLFDTRNIIGDTMTELYNNDGLKIDICYGYSYFEVFGLTDTEYDELGKYYRSLRGFA